MRSFVIKPGDLIPIGRAGENQATEIRFDVTGWAETFGAGTFELIMQRPGESELPYPVEVTVDGDYVVWTVSNVDTGIAGNCKVQLRYVVSDAVAKSVIYRGIVGESLDHAVDPPDPYDDLIERIEELARQTEQNAEAASRSAGNASDSADAAGRSAGNASDSADAAGRSATAADQSATDANAAKLASQRAQQLAEAAQADAEAAEARIMDTVPDAVTDWLNEHVDPATGYVIDDSLTVQGAAADAKAVGDALIDKAGVITDTASGAIASFPDGSAAPIKQLTVAVNPVQDLHGYDTPWPAGDGANIWDEETETGALNTTSGGNTSSNNQIRTKNFVPVVAGQAYRVVTRSGQGNGVWMMFYDSEKAVLSSDLPSGSGSSVNARRYDNGATVTMPTSCAYIRFYFQSGYGTTYNNDTAINYPSTVTTYSPYSNICPITGWTGAEVWDDPNHGGTINFNQLLEGGNFASETGWGKSKGTIAVANNKLTYTVTEKSTYQYINHAFTFNQRHKILIMVDVTLSESEAVAFGNGSAVFGQKSVTANTKTTVSYISNSTSAYTAMYLYLGRTSGLSVGATAVVENFQFFDLTQMFGAGNEPSTLDEFKALFPKAYYAYNTGTDTCVSAVNGDPYRHYQVEFPDESGTVYGANITVNEDGTGSMTVDRWYITPQNARSVAYRLTDNPPIARLLFPLDRQASASSQSNIFSSMYVTANSATNKRMRLYGSEVDIWDTDFTSEETAASILSNFIAVYKLATPITYTLSEELTAEITTLLGQNNVWADTGDVSVTYRADTKLYIDKKLAALLAALS